MYDRSNILQNQGYFGKLCRLIVSTLIVTASPAMLLAQEQLDEKYGVPLRPVADIFKPLSAPADTIYDLALLVLLICAGIFITVVSVLIYTIIRFRGKPDGGQSEPPQIYGGTQIEMAWTVLPIIITTVLILVSARTIGEIQNAVMPEEALRIRVVGHQWWWEVHYLDREGNTEFITANEIHVPVSSRGERRPTFILLESADVIHSFWVPQLAGKTDLIPNRTNHTWIEPFEPGVYLGNCAEYCGTQHAHMLLRVIAQQPEEYERWAANQKTPPVDDSRVARGRELFYNTSCINCHTVDGTIATGVFGPNLTKLMTRQTLAAGAAMMTPENLHAWVANPQDIKPGCLMPDMKLLEDEVTEIVAYLQTLK